MASALLLVALACGRSAPDEGPTSPPDAPPAAPTESGRGPAEDTGDLPNQTFPIDQAFWHSGFHVTLTEGRYYGEEQDFSDEIRYFVAIAASFENLGGFDTFFDGATALEAGGQGYPIMFGSDIPTVPIGLSSTGEFFFEVDADFDVDSARLLVGSPDERQAQIPLGNQRGPVISLEPVPVAISGSVSLQLIDLQFTGGELRADRPESYSQVPAGKWALTLFFDATSRKSGNWNVLPQDFTLNLPDGSTVGLEGSELASLPGAEEGLDTDGLWLRFLVDDPPAGTYTLRFTPGSWFIGDDGVDEDTFEFVIP